MKASFYLLSDENIFSSLQYFYEPCHYSFLHRINEFCLWGFGRGFLVGGFVFSFFFLIQSVYAHTPTHHLGSHIPFITKCSWTNRRTAW